MMAAVSAAKYSSKKNKYPNVTNQLLISQVKIAVATLFSANRRLIAFSNIDDREMLIKNVPTQMVIIQGGAPSRIDSVPWISTLSPTPEIKGNETNMRMHTT